MERLGATGSLKDGLTEDQIAFGVGKAVLNALGITTARHQGVTEAGRRAIAFYKAATKQD